MRRFVFLLTVAAAVFAFLWGNTAVRAFCAEATYPFRRVAGWAGGQLSGRFGAAWRGFCDGPSRAAAEDEVERLRVMLREASRTAQENAELREALGWARAQPRRVVAAPVWSHGGGLGVWPRLTLGVGSARGVAAGDTVVAPEGLVGRVAEGVSPHLCEVILISDPASRVAVEIPGVAKGILFGGQGSDFGEAPGESLLYSGAPLTLRYLRRGEALKPRQAVLTEGSGGLFPRGLTVGTIAAMREGDGLLAEAVVEPAADPTLLRTVFVLTREVRRQ
mgnify:CR=1 FL=1